MTLLPSSACSSPQAMVAYALANRQVLGKGPRDVTSRVGGSAINAQWKIDDSTAFTIQGECPNLGSPAAARAFFEQVNAQLRAITGHDGETAVGINGGRGHADTEGSHAVGVDGGYAEADGGNNLATAIGANSRAIAHDALSVATATEKNSGTATSEAYSGGTAITNANGGTARSRAVFSRVEVSAGAGADANARGSNQSMVSVNAAPGAHVVSVADSSGLMVRAGQGATVNLNGTDSGVRLNAGNGAHVDLTAVGSAELTPTVGAGQTLNSRIVDGLVTPQ